MKSKKIIVWGHPLHSHTHSYINYAFYRTFKSICYETHWIDSIADIGALDLSDSIFIVEGQVDGNIPLRNDCSIYFIIVIYQNMKMPILIIRHYKFILMTF